MLSVAVAQSSDDNAMLCTSGFVDDVMFAHHRPCKGDASRTYILICLYIGLIPVVKPVWQPVKCLYTRYNRLSNLLSNRLPNRFDNRLYCVYKHSTGCQTRLTTGLTTGCIVYTAGCQTCCTTRFDNRVEQTVCSFNTIVKPVWQPVWQPVGCLFTRYSLLSNRLWQRVIHPTDNRLYRVNGVVCFWFRAAG